MDTSLQITTSSESRYDPVFLRILSEIPSGGVLAVDRIPGTTKELKKGTMLALSNTAGMYQPVKTAKVVGSGGATVTHYQLAAPAEFIVGEALGVAGGATGATISAVTRQTNTVTVVVDTALGVLVTADTFVHESTASGATTNLYLPKYLLKDNIDVREADYTTLQNISFGVVARADVDESLMPYPITTVQKTAMTDRFMFV